MTAGPVSPPSRWLLLVTSIVVVTFTVGRFALAAQLDLRSDEAYYWTWSHQSALSFLDQPPMVAWFERLGLAIFGDTPLGARFAQLLALPLIQLLLADVARRRTASWNAALFVVLMLECATNYAVFAIVVEPSVPLLLFISLMLWALCRLDETLDGKWWLLVGVAGGFALLSKYIVLLVLPAILIFLLLSSRHRGWLATFWPWLAALIAILLFAPVIVWNARHGWVSFAFQSTRLGQGHEMGTGDLLRFGMYEALFAGPLLVLAAIAGSVRLGVRSVRSLSSFDAAIALAFLFALGFFLLRSLSFQINQSWAYFVWPIGILALVLSLQWNRRSLIRAVVLAGIILTSLPLSASLLVHGTIDKSVWFGRGDPFGQDAGYGDAASKVLAEAREAGATWIATSEYRTYGNLLWHIGGSIPVLQINERSRFLDFAQPAPAEVTGPALYVYLGSPTPVLEDARRERLGAIPVIWRGVEMAQLQLDLLRGFNPEIEPPPGSNAYFAFP